MWIGLGTFFKTTCLTWPCTWFVSLLSEFTGHSWISPQEYCVNQGAAIKVLKSLRDSNPELASHLQVFYPLFWRTTRPKLVL
jgi:hypothetical protein